MDDLSEKIRTLESELSELKKTINPNKKKWFRDGAILVSILALVFSIATTFISYYQATLAERRENYSRFRSVVDSLTNLPLEYFAIEEKIKNDYSARGHLEQIRIAKEKFILAQAITYLNSDHEIATSTEHIAVARALSGPGSWAIAKGLYLKVTKESMNLDDIVVAYRNLGGLSFEAGEIEEGRKYWRLAKEEVNRDRYKLKHFEIEFTSGMTEIFWARDELIIGNCEEAELHTKTALRHYNSLPEGFGIGLHSEAMSIISRINECNGLEINSSIK